MQIKKSIIWITEARAKARWWSFYSDRVGFCFTASTSLKLNTFSCYYIKYDAVKNFQEEFSRSSLPRGLAMWVQHAECSLMALRAVAFRTNTECRGVANTGPATSVLTTVYSHRALATSGSKSFIRILQDEFQRHARRTALLCPFSQDGTEMPQRLYCV